MGLNLGWTEVQSNILPLSSYDLQTHVFDYQLSFLGSDDLAGINIINGILKVSEL